MKNLAFIFILILVVANSGFAQEKNQVENLIKLGVESRSKAGSTTDIDKNMGFLETAIKHFTDALEIEPKNLKVLLERAKTYKTLFEYEKALADCEQALEFVLEDSNPNRSKLYTIYKTKGEIYEHAEDYKNAIANYQTALKYNPTDSGLNASINRNRILAGEDLSDAEIDQALNSSIGNLRTLPEPKNISPEIKKFLYPKPDKFYNLGLANLKKAKIAKTEKSKNYFYDLAYKNFSKSIEINSTFAQSYFQRSKIYEDDVERKLEDINTAIELKPDFADAYIERVDLWSFDDYENRLNDINKALELKPADTDILVRRGEIYLNQYEFEKALTDVDKALKKIQSAKRPSRSKLAAVYYLYGRIYEEGLYLDKAIAAFTTARKFDLRNAEIYLSRAKIYEYIGETNKAEADFAKAEKLIETGKNSSQNNINLNEQFVIGTTSVIEYPENFQRIWFKEVSGYQKGIVFTDSDKDGEISGQEFRQAHIARLNKLNNLVRFNPKSDLALWKRGNFFLQLDDLSNQLFWISTEGDFIDAFEINPRYEYLVNRGVVRARRNNKTNYEFAIKFFSDAIEINNKSVEAFYNRGLSYRKLNENEKAIADFTEVIKLEAGFALAYKSRAKAFRATGKIADAETDEAMLKRLGGK